jgi:GNAT superfamily N-acetyltransferase
MRSEDEHNLVLGLAGILGSTPATGPEGCFFATVEHGDEVVGAVFRTPPYKAGVTRMPVAAASAVAGALATRYRELPALFGPVDEALAVGAAWAELRGVEARRGLPQRMYRLDEVVLPTGVPGSMRLAVEGDLPTVHRWADGFAEDAGGAFATPPRTRVGWVSGSGAFLWEDAGTPVSMAVASGRTDHGVRIGYVYTPPERRGRGFASALVAALSRRQLDEGARFCVLYTDLTNPTSNAIYPRIGYRPLMDLVDVDFVQPAAPQRGR